jgi:hypothetical protein
VYGATAGVVLVVMGALLAFRERWPKDIQVSLPSSALEVILLAGSLAVMVAALVYGARHQRLARAFTVAWVAGAVLITVSYHEKLERRNQAHDYVRLRAEIRRQLADASLVATWGAHELPLTFYFNRPVVAIETAGQFRHALAQDPRTVAILTDSAAARFGDHAGLTVLLRDRLAFRPISVVSYSATR